ncbi:MAG: 2-hydroxychromene-2-carboxylate isomerase, partial [Halioglobus sp.]
MTQQPDLEFFYDCSSPWTYFAFTRIIPMAAELDIPIRWRPILVGGVFNMANQQLYAARESMFANEKRLAHYFKDMMDWANFIDIKVAQPDVFPVNSVKAMRGALFAEEQGLIVPFSQALFSAYWGDNKDISQIDVLRDICQSVGLDPNAFLAAIADPHYKDLLRSNTEELVARGGYGSPTLFINGDDMYFGNDRL